jgi:dihydrofolate reductase
MTIEQSPVAMIVAYGNDRIIGANNKLPWPERSIPSDMERFREVTRGQTVIMGPNTFESLRDLNLPNGLPGRENIVVSRRARDYGEKVLVAHTISGALEMTTRELPVIIGGAKIYDLAMPYATKIFATEVLADFDGDTQFPVLGPEWEEVEGSRINVQSDVDEKRDLYPMQFVTYKKTA